MPRLLIDDEDRWLRLADLARYSSLSVRTLTRLMRDPVHPLPAHRIGRTVLVKRSDYDAWLHARDGGGATSTTPPAPDPRRDEARQVARELRGFPVVATRTK